MSDIKKQQELASELSSKLWKMANDLRGNMDANEFKNYILGLIFYRFLSQKVENYFEEQLKDDGITYAEAFADPEYKESLKADSLDSLGYIIEPKYLFSHVIKMIEEDKFTIDYMEEIINAITTSTENQPSEDAFTDLFEDMDLKSSKLGKEIKQRTKLISTILNTIDDIEVDFDDAQSDILGTAYMTLIGNFASSAGKKGGEFFTPYMVSRLLARISTLGLERAESAFDPTCGSGSLLLQLGEYCKINNYAGQELNSTTYNLARMNMTLHGVKYEDFKIVNCDTLLEKPFEDKKFTICVANPPYSVKWDSPASLLDDERFSVYGKLAPKSAADFAFVQTMIHHMADDGRIAVLLPHGVLFRGGAEETIRKYIIENLNYLDAVIGLPAGMFQGTGIPVCLLVLKKERNGNSDNICFIDASKHFTSGKAMNYITDEDIDRIINAYQERKDIDKFCHVAKMAEIKENDYNLNIPRYVDTFEPEPEVDINQVIKDIHKVDKEITSATEEVNKYLKELGLPLL